MIRTPFFLGMLLFFLLLCTACASHNPGPKIGPFFVSLEQDTRDGMLETSRLTLVPAPEEYRAEAWKTLSVSVSLPLKPGEDGRMQALRKAWETLLLREGTRSITGHSQMTDRHLYARSSLRYEGMVEDPIRVSAFTRDAQGVHLTLKARFAPIAFPDQWERLRKERARQELLREIFSVFE